MNGGLCTEPRMIIRLLVLLIVLCAVPAAAQAQARSRGVPPEAAEPLHEALKLLDTIRVSNLDAPWRANAFARMARLLARVGDAEAARTMSNSALAAVDEPVKTPPPAAISPGVIYALLVQTHADLHDVEIAQKLAERGFAVLQTLPDVATRANLLPYMALGLADIGNRDGAGLAALEGLRAATQVPPGRDQIAALAQVTMVQAKIGDHAQALETLEIARQAAGQIADVTGRVYALAHLARAEAAVGNQDRARTLARESAMAYDRTQTDGNFTVALRVTTLGLIAVAQSEAADRNAARQTVRALQQTVAQLFQTYEKFQALVTEVDTIIQVDRVL
jgi:tetratricopeptide (TPR) repeat protein